jgi:phosphatidate cytidylyltransferase
MLWQRVVTAVAMLLVLLPALFHSQIEPCAALSLVLIVAAAWEWGRLNGLPSVWSLLAGVALGLALGLLWWNGGVQRPLPALWWTVGTVWVLLATLMLRRGVLRWADWPVWPRRVLGWFLIACAWLALVQARLQGLDFLLSVLVLVWTADVAAYFGGKAFGRRKLAPSVSPGKSWEGVYSGVLGVALVGTLWLYLDHLGVTPGGSLFQRLWSDWGWGAALLLAGLVAMSVAGDLVESLVKRSAGVKDSSRLLPGHGGVLDRVDALLPVLPLAMMVISR